MYTFQSFLIPSLPLYPPTNSESSLQIEAKQLNLSAVLMRCWALNGFGLMRSVIACLILVSGILVARSSLAYLFWWASWCYVEIIHNILKPNFYLAFRHINTNIDSSNNNQTNVKILNKIKIIVSICLFSKHFLV